LSTIYGYYIGVAGRNTAYDIIRSIVGACQLLEAHPFAGRPRNEVRAELRSVVAIPYVVFYRVSKDEIAEIVRVLDGRQDIEEIFLAD
jgi:toxin ParE1/3/4